MCQVSCKILLNSTDMVKLRDCVYGQNCFKIDLLFVHAVESLQRSIIIVIFTVFIALIIIHFSLNNMIYFIHFKCNDINVFKNNLLDIDGLK